MKRSSIQARFDEIVDFSELATFLDTPIKRYSSGMRVRLAFAVAAHLEPEILIVDEVLAVGDVAFQRKCLGKMGDITSEGRTILFVSHNMAVLQALCQRGILFERGSLVADGSIEETIEGYLRRLEDSVGEDLRSRTDRRGWHEVFLAGLSALSAVEGVRTITPGVPVRFVFQLSAPPPWNVQCRFTILDTLGHPVMTFDSSIAAAEDQFETAGCDTFECVVPALPLVPGRYRIDVKVRGAGRLQDHVEGARYFEIEPGVMGGRPISAGEAAGSVAVPHVWRVSSPGEPVDARAAE
jgi:lipopolysaccharide transport system ATP-binding protein